MDACDDGEPNTKVQYLVKVSNDGKIGIISKGNDLFVNHESKDSLKCLERGDKNKAGQIRKCYIVVVIDATRPDNNHWSYHLSSTSIVQFNSTLLKLGVFIKVVPSKVNVSVAEVTNKFVSGSGNTLHESNLEDSNESNDLYNSSSRNGIRTVESGNTVGVRVEGVTRVVNVSGQMDSGTSDNLSKEGQLTNASVLDFDVTKTIESLLIGSRQKTEGIKESKRSLSTEFVRKGGIRHLHNRGGCLLGDRGKGSDGRKKRGENGKLHDDSLSVNLKLLKLEIVSLVLLEYC